MEPGSRVTSIQASVEQIFQYLGTCFCLNVSLEEKVDFPGAFGIPDVVLIMKHFPGP